MQILYCILYIYCFFLGKTDGKKECLKSILAIYLFRAKIKSLKDTGIDFSTNLIVPECDEQTKEELHHREDHNHLLKRIINCMREDLLPGCSVVYLRDALNDPSKSIFVWLLFVCMHIHFHLTFYFNFTYIILFENLFLIPNLHKMLISNCWLTANFLLIHAINSFHWSFPACFATCVG